MENCELNLIDERYPDRRFWTFKHKPGVEGGSEFWKFMDTAYKMNVCMMQYEYTEQPSNMVTQNWEVAAKMKIGDVVFLRGDTRLYAVGVVTGHGLEVYEDGDEEEMVVETSLRETLGSRKHGPDNQWVAGKYWGSVIFSDSEVFFEDLTACNGWSGSWGQRVRVEKWLYYTRDGIDCRSNEYYSDSGVYVTIRELKKESAEFFLQCLVLGYLKEKGVDPMIMDLLTMNKNLVLTGAPGTGKTFLAGVVAEGLTGGDASRIIRVQFHPSYGYPDFIEGLRPAKNAGGEIAFERKDGAFMDVCRKAKDSPDKSFVVIIDEINRGDISKIFGELFSLIEPDYRTFDGRQKNGTFVAVKTQYYNLMDENDIFKNGFYVPPNVYIIGTMNDVDRSVESMDFAIRRRFVWHEVKPNDRFDAMWGEENEGVSRETAKERMNALNAMISNDPTLGEAYQIGPSYFMKLKDLNGDYERLWNQSLRLLLKEYLRGIPDAQKKLDDFHAILVKGSVE